MVDYTHAMLCSPCTSWLINQVQSTLLYLSLDIWLKTPNYRVDQKNVTLLHLHFTLHLLANPTTQCESVTFFLVHPVVSAYIDKDKLVWAMFCDSIWNQIHLLLFHFSYIWQTYRKLSGIHIGNFRVRIGKRKWNFRARIGTFGRT